MIKIDHLSNSKTIKEHYIPNYDGIKVELIARDSQTLPKKTTIYEVEVYIPESGSLIDVDGFGIKEQAIEHFNDMVELYTEVHKAMI